MCQMRVMTLRVGYGAAKNILSGILEHTFEWWLGEVCSVSGGGGNVGSGIKPLQNR